MKRIPETSTTLLRDIASDAESARWGEFVARYRPMMQAYLKTHFPLLDADDIVQETLVALASVLPRYRYAPDETGHFRNYLTGILRNKALKRNEKIARDSALRKSLQVTEASGPLQKVADADGKWRKAVMEIATRQLLADSRIHERSKQIFQRLTVDCMAPDAVAAAYGVSRNSVDKIKSRMVERLREIVRALEAAGDV
ncbi:MAG: sigma-70 family RNA polymerase sigma factor [Kiritimatiellae bacterium]|nr:sigma-70 family RNA polymerase sigma factor [Kiritimatiellia bacterium]